MIKWINNGYLKTTKHLNISVLNYRCLAAGYGTMDIQTDIQK